MENTATARIDLGALRNNLAVVRELCPESNIMAMVKADAYGHGLVPACRALSAADGLAVARLKEALLIRKTGITQRLLLLGTLFDDHDLAVCAGHDIDVTAHDKMSVASIIRQARHTPLRVWLELDSGMHRLGLSGTEFVEADGVLSTHAGIRELIHMTHFSSADSVEAGVMERELRCFWEFHNLGSKSKISLANSAALIVNPATRADWVRPGIMLYGENPVSERLSARLRPAMTLLSRIVSIREVRRGESVGYNGRWTADRRSRVGTVGIGYGDGYPRHACNGTPVWINGNVVPVVGQVSMDSLTVDLTECDGVKIGTEVTLWGSELPVATVAKFANTTSYELFTSLNQRVTREYFG